MNARQKVVAEVRDLNSTEIKVFTKERYDRMSFDLRDHLSHEISVQYVHRPDGREGDRNRNRKYGGFTICVVTVDGLPDRQWLGVSHRSYRDRPNRVHGQVLAFLRAITSPASDVAASVPQETPNG